MNEMSAANAIATVGVALLLVAFFLNLFGFVGHRARSYSLLNALGAGLSCYASCLIGFFPFVILEATWTVVAVVALFRHRR